MGEITSEFVKGLMLENQALKDAIQVLRLENARIKEQNRQMQEIIKNK